MVKRFLQRLPPGPQGLFGMLAAWILRRPYAWSAGLVLAGVVATLLSSHLAVSSDLIGLLPDDDASVNQLRELDRQEGGANHLTIAIVAADQPTADAFAEDLGQRLGTLSTVRHALWKVPPEVIRMLAPLQLTQEELRLLHSRLRGAIALGPAAQNPFIASRIYALGPLAQKLTAPEAKVAFTNRPNSAKIIVRPAGSSHDIPFARRFMSDVQTAIAAADPAGHGVTIPWISGAHRHAIDDVDGIGHDIGWTAIPTLILVSLAIAIAFMDWKPVVIIMVPQFLGSALTLGFATLAIGSVNMFTSFALAVLVGLGNDYGIVLFSRFREERAAGHSTDEAIIRAWSLAGPAALTAALTAAAGFFSLFVASFKGFQQLGLVIGAGVPLCFGSVVCVAPLLIRLLEPGQVPTLANRVARASNRFSATPYRIGLPIVLLGAALGVVGAVALPHLRFDDDLSDLRRKGLSYAELTEEQRTIAREGYSPIVLSYPDEVSMDADWDLINSAMADGRLTHIARALSVRSIIPRDVHERAAIVRQIADLAREPNARYLPPQIQELLQPLADAEPTEDFVVAPSDLPESIQGTFGAAIGKHRILLIPSGNQWAMRENVATTDEISALLPGRLFAGEYVCSAVLFRMVMADAPRIMIAATVLVALLIYLDLRSFKRAALVMAVQCTGMLWAMGMRVFTDMPFNLVNFIGIPICMGTGIQAAIFLSHRLHEEGRGGIRKSLVTTGLASTQSICTTLLAFSTLILADSRGVRSLGVGILTADAVVALSGFLMLPAAYAVAYWIWPKVGTSDVMEPPQETA
jgi:predicted RND superfamily exporter protein